MKMFGKHEDENRCWRDIFLSPPSTSCFFIPSKSLFIFFSCIFFHFPTHPLPTERSLFFSIFIFLHVHHSPYISFS